MVWGSIMKSWLSRLNRNRLFRRAERRMKKMAKQNEMQLSESECSAIISLLGKFTPISCGEKLQRIGPVHDGGYLLPDNFEGIQALYSPGVSDTLGFDLEIAERGILCFLADGTVNQPLNMHPNMHFEKMMIGDGPADTYLSMDNWVARTAPPDGDLMLQMDIEGAEYEALLSSSRALLDRFRIIILELHGLDRYLFGDARILLERLMDNLLENHIICHVHPNNVCPPVNILGRVIPPIIELTLIRKDSFPNITGDEATYPHPLDAPNVPNLPIRAFPPFWRAS